MQRNSRFFAKTGYEEKLRWNKDREASFFSFLLWGKLTIAVVSACPQPLNPVTSAESICKIYHYSSREDLHQCPTLIFLVHLNDFANFLCSFFIHS